MVIIELYEIKRFECHQISHFLMNEGYKSIQSNKPILPN